MDAKDKQDALIVFDRQVAKRNVFVDEADIKRIFEVALEIVARETDPTKASPNEKERASQRLTDYAIGEWEFYKENNSEPVKEGNYQVLAIKAANKYLSQRASASDTDREGILPYYDPRVSTLTLAVTYYEHINRPLSRINPNVTLMNDLFETTFNQIDSVMKMISMGLYRDAFSAWRNIHESECIIKILVDNGDPARYAYTRHLAYNNFYRNKEQFSKEQLDAAFADIKAEMKEHDLKSKDMKKFIEYGWLYACPSFDLTKDNTLKLNFRDGLEKIAGLKYYENEDDLDPDEKPTTIYEYSSEIAHSSYLFFYSNDVVFRDLSLSCVYRSSITIFETYLSYMDNYLSRQKGERNNCIVLLNDTKEIYKFFKKKEAEFRKENEQKSN